jgi:glucokinase
MDRFLAFDLGGTKVLGGWVSKNGEILEKKKEFIDLSHGPKAMVLQIAKMAISLKGDAQVRSASMASAGPLDPKNGLLLDPTNMKTGGQSWGVIPLTQWLQEETGLSWRLENDAAAAAMAESWVGESRGYENSITITLGTGVGVGIIANGELLRSGRGLHPEVSHMIIEHENSSALCGCGNYGCAEAYLSGVNFSKLVSRRLNQTITAEELLQKAESGDLRVREEFSIYARRLAIFMTSLVVSFSPEVIVLAGGFSHAAPIYLDTLKYELHELLKRRRAGIDLLPEVRLSRFKHEAGLLGAAKALIR